MEVGHMTEVGFARRLPLTTSSSRRQLKLVFPRRPSTGSFKRARKARQADPWRVTDRRHQSRDVKERKVKPPRNLGLQNLKAVLVVLRNDEKCIGLI